jgi:hypothetical protein
MNEDDKQFLIVRFLGAVCGLIGGVISGTILLVLLIVFTGFTFGLVTIWPGTVAGAIIGTGLGFLFPKIGIALIEFYGRVR